MAERGGTVPRAIGTKKDLGIVEKMRESKGAMKKEGVRTEGKREKTHLSQ